MIFQETRRSRRIVGRVEEDEDFVQVLTRLCEEHGVRAGRLEAIGSFSKVELARFMPQEANYQVRFAAEGVFDIISLGGNISTLGQEVALRLECLLGVDAPAGQQFVSGQLRAARAVSVEFVLDIFEDLAVERRLDAKSGRLNIRSIQRVELEQDRLVDEARPQAQMPAASPQTRPAAERTETKPAAPAESAPIAGKGLSWKDAMAEAGAPTAKADGERGRPSASELYADVDLTEPAIQSGDILDHPKLGRCRVMKVEDGEFVHVRLPRGKIRKLSLDIVDVEFEREENGRSVFRAVISR